jgi:hypothetical protein
MKKGMCAFVCAIGLFGCAAQTVTPPAASPSPAVDAYGVSVATDDYIIDGCCFCDDRVLNQRFGAEHALVSTTDPALSEAIRRMVVRPSQARAPLAGPVTVIYDTGLSY